MPIFVCLCMHTCVCVHIRVCIYVCVWVYVCICSYVCTFVSVYVERESTRERERFNLMVTDYFTGDKEFA